MKQLIEIKGMSCNHCVMHVKEGLMELKGVDEVDVDLGKNIATIKSNIEINKELIIETIKEMGYEVLNII